MKRNPKLEERRKKVPADVKLFVEMAFKMADQVESILKKKGMSQRDFANVMGKSESEISKWLTGEQNFTLRSIAKMQSVLGEPLILFPMDFEKKQFSHGKVVISNPVNSFLYEKWSNKKVKVSQPSSYSLFNSSSNLSNNIFNKSEYLNN